MNMCEMTGYNAQTTFWDDFSIADAFGLDAISLTFERTFESWKTNYIYLTELIMVLNWKIWYWYNHSEDYSALYQDLWERADQWALENLSGSALDYFLRMVD